MKSVRTTIHTAASVALLSGATFALLAVAPNAQTAQATTQTDDDAYTKKAKRDNLRRMSKVVTIEVEDQPIEDIFQFLADVTGADLEPIYLNDETSVAGIDPETLITFKATNIPAITVLERILARANRIEQPGDDYTWQFTEWGSIEFGPKAELNRNQRVEIYDIADLLFVVPDFNNPPTFTIQSTTTGRGGGGGTPPFTNTNTNTDTPDSQERIDKLINLLQTTIEPDQWADMGGDGGAITVFGTSLIITAPDYVHRQIDGYSFWPARLTQARTVDGKRQVRIKGDPKYRKSSKP